MSFVFVKLPDGTQKAVRWAYKTDKGVMVKCVDHATLLGDISKDRIPVEDEKGVKSILTTLVKRGIIESYSEVSM